MPVTQKQKSSRGIPRKSRNPARKARHARYWTRASCFQCGLVFRSPKYARHHKENGHSPKIGLRKQHIGVQEAAMGAIKDKLTKAVFA